MLQMLLLKQPGLSVFNHFGNTALQEAARRCTDDMMAPLELLLEHGAQVNHTTMDGMAPLHTAAYHRGVAAVKFLLHHGASVSAKNKDGHTALDIATRRGNSAIVMLLEHHQIVESGVVDETE